MKNSLVIAAAALLGAADAGMHRMKLQKVPLSDQLVRWLLHLTRHAFPDLNNRALATLTTTCEPCATNTRRSPSAVPLKTSSEIPLSILIARMMFRSRTS
jgi:hypothetical protein